MIKLKTRKFFPIILIVVLLLYLLISVKGVDLWSDNSIEAINSSLLLQRIDEAHILYNMSVEGTEAGQYNQGSKSIFWEAIRQADSTLENVSVTQEQIELALLNLDTAMADFYENLISRDNIPTDEYSTAPSGNGEIIDIYLITEVTSYGEKVMAAIIEYDAVIDGNSLDTSSYTVFNGNRDARTITSVYTNNSMAFSDEVKNGVYVIVELDHYDDNAGTLAYSFETGLNTRSAPDYEITQIKDIYLENGTIIQPSGNASTSTVAFNLIADKFEKLSYYHNAFKLNYRFFKPNTVSEVKYPLVVFLHGAGERGNNNDVQILASKGAVVWADPESQRINPAFILAPQAPARKDWTTAEVKKALFDLIDDVIRNHPIDTDRIYITGLSLGGNGVWSLIQNNPDIFSAALSICGWGNPNHIAAIKDMPIWVFHSEDDATIPVSRSREMVAALKAAGSNVLYTEYPAGTVRPNHFSWVPTFENEDVAKWLFEQKK